MSEQRITMIGGGNMGRAIALGLLQQGYSPSNIEIIEPDADRRASLHRDDNLNCQENVTALSFQPTVVILAVKPQIMREVLESLRPVLTPLQKSAVIISIAAGITSKQISRWLDGDFKIVRVMPNTPAMIGQGASALFANNAVSPAEKTIADNILSAVGISVWVDEETQIDAVTALSGSGPAYFFLVLEALEAAGVKLGLNAVTARELAIQTALGAASLAQQSGVDPVSLRKQVTSPGGTTERALEVLFAQGVPEIFSNAVTAAYERAQELAQQTD